VVLRVQSSGFRVQGSGCRVQGSGFRVQGSGCGRRTAQIFRVWGVEKLLGAFVDRGTQFGVWGLGVSDLGSEVDLLCALAYRRAEFPVHGTCPAAYGVTSGSP